MAIVREPAPAPTGTWGISPTVRRALARTILDLRAAVEDDFRKQLTALGVRTTGSVPAGLTLDAHEQRARTAAEAVIARDVLAGASQAEAVEGFVRESAFTFLNRLVGLRCLDERGLLVVDGQSETAVKTDPARNASSLYWRVRNALPPATNPREVWRETLRRAGAAISTRIRVLFDPDAEHAALLPLLPTLQRVVEALNAEGVPSAVWAEDEVLGWVYQYYNTQEKDAAYARLAKGKKLETPEELAAATTLYTERYMVDYLLQNTLGALWAEMHPDSRLPERWPYYVKPVERRSSGADTEGNPAVEREARPLREITLIDPACGSGHFLVRAFELLEEMYREEGREAEEDIPALILERNLHGVDIDARAVQIAALALYLRACASAGPDFRPRRLNLVSADVRLAGEEPAAAYLARFRGDPELDALVKGIWQGLKNARELGSLLHPERAVDVVVEQRRARERGQLWEHGDEDWARWKRDLLVGLRGEFERQAQSEDMGQRLFGEEAAKGVSLVQALGDRYDVVVMNPPYAGSKNLSDGLKKFVEREYKEGKRDLYAAFVQRCWEFAWRDGYVGMVTQQSWLFLRSFAALRKKVLEETAVTTLAHLGPRAFEEIGGEVVNIALFTLRNAPPPVEHRMTAFRLIGPKSPAEKDALLRLALAGRGSGVLSTPKQADFLTIPGTPFVYWLRSTFSDFLRLPNQVGKRAFVRQGICTTDNGQFVRCFWEVEDQKFRSRWFLFAKGGGFRRWAGFEQFVLDWEENGRRVKEFQENTPGAIHWSGRMPADSYFFRGGWTFSRVLRGTLAVRGLRRDSYFGHTSPAAIPYDASDEPVLGFWLNARVSTYLLRAYSQGLDFREGHVQRLPLPSEPRPVTAERLIRPCIYFRRLLISLDPTEWTFGDLQHDSAASTQDVLTIESLYLLAESVRESASISALQLTDDDVREMDSELGTPAGWYPLLPGYDAIPAPPDGITLQVDLAAHLRDHEHRALASDELARLKSRLRALYQAGPGASVVDSANEEAEPSGDGEDDGGEAVALGARIPIPTETFLEELSQKLEVHPISVYWLLKEMREQEGLVCPPELKRHLEDYASVSILRLLGYRWPEQDAYESEHGPIMDPTLVDEDGIIPLVPCGDQPTAAQRIRMRLERDFGEEGADQSEQELRQWMGRPIEDWLKRDFFKRHIQQFKQRPIAWHLVSPERTFEAFVLYHKLSRATLQKLRAQYAGGLLARLRAEQERARQAGKTAEVSSLQFKIEDVEELRSRIEQIERGDELKYRIRCRWKGEEEDGRPGPYDFDVDDGVKVNIRPFQEAGLLAVKEVIKKW